MRKTGNSQVKLPTIHNWRTTDEDEIARRRLRAQTESLRVRNLDPRFPIFSNFSVMSESGLTYSVEIRSVSQRRFSCNCVDFRINALGTCKHIEATLLYLESRYRRLYGKAQKNSTERLDVIPDLASGALRIEGDNSRLPPALARMVKSDGILRTEDPEEAVKMLQRAGIPSLRISQEVAPWLETRQREQERKSELREYEQKVQSGEWPAQETLVPLYPYQREGMRHLAFSERALLADEMGLGKTIQALSVILSRATDGPTLVVAPTSVCMNWAGRIRSKFMRKAI